MSDPRAIGIFDSGIGGLTVLEEIHHTLPSESTVYLGDVARCPYGPRPAEEVRRFAVQIARFLETQHPLKLLVIACNTASAAALDDVRRAVPHLPVVGVVEPGARAALIASQTRRIGVIATAGTVRSHAYRRAVHEADPAAYVVEEACPQLVPLVEAGATDTPEAEYWVRTYLEPLWASHVDTLILGCTHYPLLRRVIERVTAGRLSLVDSAQTTAARVRELLDGAGSLASSTGGPVSIKDGPPLSSIACDGLHPSVSHILYTTGAPREFRDLADRLFHLAVHDVHYAALATDDIALPPTSR